MKETKQYKRFFFISICLLITGRLLLLLVNYVVDPYEVLQSNFLHHSGSTNQRFLKVEHLLNTKGKHNSYIVGNSSAGVVDPDVIEQYMPGSSFYNLSLNGGTIYEHTLMLYAMLKEGVPVSNVLLMLNVDFMTASELRDYDKPLYKKSPEYRLHPIMLRNISGWKYYFDYLKQFHLLHIKFKLIKNIYPRLDIDIVNNGMLSFIKEESCIAEDPAGHIKEIDKSFEKTNEKNLSLERVQIIGEIIDFKKVCKANNVNLTIIISPTNYNRLNLLNATDYLLFLSDLSQETDYWNFSGYNSIALDNLNFYDLNHFRPYVADLMMHKIFNDYNGPDDFGFYVTRDNISNHLSNLQSQFDWASKELKHN